MSYQNRAGTEIHSFYALSCNVQRRLSILNYISVSDCFSGCYYENTCAYQNCKPLFLRNLCICISLCFWYHFVSNLCYFSCEIRLPLRANYFTCAFPLVLYLRPTNVIKCAATIPVNLPVLFWHVAFKGKRKQITVMKDMKIRLWNNYLGVTGHKCAAKGDF